MRDQRITEMVFFSVVAGLIVLSSACGDDDTQGEQTETTAPTPHLTSRPETVDFGIVVEGSVNTTEVTLFNDGSGPASITSMEVAGSPDFSTPRLSGISFPFDLGVFVPDDSDSQQVLTFEVIYSPTTGGTDEGFVRIEYDSMAGAAQVLSLSLRGQAGGSPCLVLSPNPIDFGRVPVETTRTFTVTLSNRCSHPVEVFRIYLVPVGCEFRIVSLPPELENDEESLTLESGSSIPLGIEYTPAGDQANACRLLIQEENGVETLLVTGVGGGAE